MACAGPGDSSGHRRWSSPAEWRPDSDGHPPAEIARRIGILPAEPLAGLEISASGAWDSNVWLINQGRRLRCGRRDRQQRRGVRGDRAGWLRYDIHLHHYSDEVAYVLRGEISFNLGDEFTVGGPGTCAFMPRGVPHAWKNTDAETGPRAAPLCPGRGWRGF